MAGAGVAFQNDASWGFDSRTTMAGKSAERDAVLDLEGHVARFFNSSDLNLAKLKPNGRLSSTGICLANEGTEYVVYVDDSATSFTVDLSAAEGTTFRARWYDSRTGTFSNETEIVANAKQQFHSPNRDPRVLWLRKR